MAFPAIDNTRVNAAKHIDDWYAAEVVAGKEIPYASLAVAYAAIPSAVRMKGRSFIVTENGLTVEYWWKDDLTTAIPKLVGLARPLKDISGVKYLDGDLSSDGTQILNNYDSITGTPFNATKTTTWVDGTAMNDSKVDNGIYFKNKPEIDGYSKRDYEGSAKSQWFGIISSTTVDQTTVIQKAIDAIPLGGKLEFVNGSYIYSQLKRFENKFLEGNNSYLLQTGNKVMLEGKGVWQLKVDVTALETVAVTQLAQTYYVTKVTCDTTGYAPKDLVKIYSRDLIQDTSIPGRYLGEFASVEQVFPTYLLLNSTIEDAYSTQVKVARLANNTANINGFNFDRKPGEAIVVPQDAGSGGGAYIRLSGLVNPQITNCTVKNSISNAVVMHSCYGYNVDIQARDLPNQPLIMRWGYGVCDANSEFGVANVMGTNVRHCFTTNTYVLNGDLDDPSNFGRSKDFRVYGSGFGGFTAHWDTHDGARRGSFNDCKSVFSDWGPELNIEPSVDSNGFVLRSSGTRIINPEITGDCGILVYTPPGQIGGNTESTRVKGVEVLNFKGTVKRNAINVKNANVKIYNPVIERTKGINYGPDSATFSKLISYDENSNVELYNPYIIERGSNSIEIVTSGDGNLLWDGGTINLEEVILNGDGQQVNYTERIFYTYKATNRQNITFKNATLILKDRIIDSIARCAGGITNASINIENITVMVTSTTKTIVGGGAFSRRIIGGSGSNIMLAIGYTVDKVNIREIKYLDVNTNAVTSNEYISQSTTIIQNSGKADKFLYTRLTPGTTALAITAIEVGRFIGQQQTIRNDHASNTFVLPSGLANTSITNSTTVQSKTEIVLRWSGTTWDIVLLPVNVPSNYLPSSIYDATNGVLVLTDLVATSVQFFNVKITGNSYNAAGRKTISTYIQARNNAGTIDSASGYSIGYPITVDLFIYNGFVYLYIPFIVNFTTINVEVTTRQGSVRGNIVGGIFNNVKPTTGVTSNVTVIPTKVLLENDGAKSAVKNIKVGTVLSMADYGTNGHLDVFLDTVDLAFTVTLPLASLTAGLTTSFVKIDANARTPTIKGNGAELINNSNTDTTLSTQYASFILKSDGTKYYKF